MEKTKLGISISLLGGALYFIGLIGITPLVVAAGYVLIAEENEWLKKVAIKAVAVVVFFAILSNAISLLADSTTFLSTLVALFNGTLNLAALNRIVTLLRVALSFFQTLLLLMLGFKALNMGDKAVGPVDRVINRHM